MWNQQVKGAILIQKMHKLFVYPQIPQKFKTTHDPIADTISDEFEYCIVQDQAQFIWLWLLLTNSENS